MSKPVDPDGTPDELQGEILDLLYEGLIRRASETPHPVGGRAATARDCVHG
jgi:hypothetical protein